MAYINVNDWKYEQVIEWLKGIECINNFYIKSFFNNQVDGQQLLKISYSELTELGISKIGHQEIILESIEHLKNFHFNLDRENLQYLALQVATVSISLHRQLLHNPESKLETSILSEVARTISRVKILISWLDRYPFQGHTNYNEIRTQMLRLALELATVGQRDRFAQTPIKQITILSEKLSKLADYIIQDISDPMILQPAYLELLTLKKKESELGFYIMPSYQFIHRITDVKFNSPAHNSGKVEDGDEIVQINYQTVVGWQFKKVHVQLQESTTDVLLTLKKRPRHSNRIYSQLGLIKLPSKKRTLPYPSPRIEPIVSSPRVEVLQEFLPQKPPIKKDLPSDTDSSENESEILTPTEVEPREKELRLYLPKPRAVLQRRHTICGEDLISYKNIGNIALWHEIKMNKDGLDTSNLRDKSVSISFGLNTRPTTSIGILNDSNNLEYFKKSSSNFINRKAINTDTILEQDGENEDENPKTGVSKVVTIDSESASYSQDSAYTCKIQETIIESFMPIPYADDDNTTEQKDSNNQSSSRQPIPVNNNSVTLNTNIAEAVNGIVINREMIKRGRLDKSYSTPTYDNNEVASQESCLDIPPRRQKNITPPVPPRKQSTLNNQQIPNISQTHIVGDGNITKKNSESTNSATFLNLSNVSQKSTNLLNNNETDHAGSNKSKPSEVSELIMSSKIKNLTNKKKISLIAKRRKISLKSLGNNSAATIQGHLYRRGKNKSEVAYWTKMYFVLMDIVLYGFKNKESQKADCAIFLNNGLTVSLAKEVHSKEHAFKVYHPKKTFYFAAETSEAMTQWIEYIRSATLKGTDNLECDSKELYSETECSDDNDLERGIQNTSSPLSSQYQTNSDRSSSIEQTPPSQKNPYHINFGSLKKTFGRNNSNEFHSDNKFLGLFTSNKSEKKATTIDIVPTAQFKTYRKVANNGGLQLGATSMINSNISDAYLPSSYGIDNNSLFNNISNNDFKNTSTDDKASTEKPIKTTHNSNSEKTIRSLRKSHNFLHASNPNLLDFNFHQTVDFPNINQKIPNCNWDHQNQNTGMTLLDLMLQQRAEEMKDMYDKRVDQGFERIEEKMNTLKVAEKQILKPCEDIIVDKKLLEIQRRCLPTPPDYAQSFKPNDQAILYTRSKEGLKLRDFGYEFISNEMEQSHVEPKIIEAKSSISKRKVAPLSGSIKKKSGFTWMISNEKDENTHQSTSKTSNLGTSGSFRKLRIGSSKNQSDIMEEKDSSLGKSKKSSSSFSAHHEVQSSTKVLRKNSAPSTSNSVIPYFTKLSFSSSNEKKLLGSPKLHRAIFGKNNSNISSNAADHEIFTSITFPKQQRECQQGEASSSGKALPRGFTMKNYPELSLPPVFKAETYSFSEK